jgi:hypothetical protein
MDGRSLWRADSGSRAMFMLSLRGRRAAYAGRMHACAYFVQHPPACSAAKWTMPGSTSKQSTTSDGLTSSTTHPSKAERDAIVFFERRHHSVDAGVLPVVGRVIRATKAGVAANETMYSKVISAQARHVTSAKTSDVISTKTSDVSSAEAAHVASAKATTTSVSAAAATAGLCVSGKKAAGKRGSG